MKFQPHVEFKAQAVAFRGLMQMFQRLKAQDGEIDPWDLLPVAVFIAFTIEAYLNSVGAKKVPLWHHLERQPWRKKVEILHEVVGTQPDWKTDPLLFACSIFALRDELAHGKTKTVPGPVVDSSETAVSILAVQHIKPPILEGLDREWATHASSRLFELLRYLGNLHGLEEDDFSSYSWGYTKRLPGANGSEA